MKLSSWCYNITQSPTLALSAKAKKMKKDGKDVKTFATGEPDFPTPKLIIDSAYEAMISNKTKYVAESGILELREAICKKLKQDNNLNYTTSEIVVTPGAKLSIFNTLQILLNEGDDVLIPAPCWVSYPDHVRLAGGNPIIVPTDESINFKVTPDLLDKYITNKTRLIILNTPSNPTGTIYNYAELEKLSLYFKNKNILVISDEIYEKLVYDGEKHISIGAFPEMKDISIIVNGFSKAYAMTGWRIGYVAGPKAFIEKMGSLIGQQVSCVAPFIQYSAITALEKANNEVEKMRIAFEKRRNLFFNELKRIPDINAVIPKGAFYVWVNVKKYLNGKIKTSEELAKYLLEEKFLVVVPGEAFEAKGYLRFSYATSEEDIIEGIKRLESGLLHLPK